MKYLYCIVWSLFALIFTGYTPVRGQYNQIIGLLKKVESYYASRPNLSFDMTYRMFESHTSNKLIQQTEGKYQCLNKQFKITTGSQTQLINERFMLVVDETSRVMILKDRVPVIQKTPLGIDTLVGMFENIHIKTSSAGLTQLEFSSPRLSFYTVRKMLITIETTTGKISEAILYYSFDLKEFYQQYNTATVPRIEIFYTNYITDQNNSRSFEETHFFTLSAQNQIVPVGVYKNFEVIDLRTIPTNSKQYEK